jgi:hypothetical protein
VEDNIRMDLREMGCGGMAWIDLDEGKGLVEGSCEHDNDPSSSIKCLEILQ